MSKNLSEATERLKEQDIEVQQCSCDMTPSLNDLGGLTTDSGPDCHSSRGNSCQIISKTGWDELFNVLAVHM